MAVTIDADQVIKIYGQSQLPSDFTAANVEPFTVPAQILLEQLEDVPEQTLMTIGAYLTAHFIVLAEESGGITRDQLGSSTEYYANFAPKNFNALDTRFGRVAVILDPTKKLRLISINQYPKSEAKFFIRSSQ